MREKSVELIPKSKRGDFLEELLDAYVDGQGLGAMPKGDLDALIVHLFIKYGKDLGFDSFQLSELFRVRESRIKSLIQTASIKFDEVSDAEAWVDLATSIERDTFELESLERGQIRFKLENPALYRFLQKWLRQNGGSATYSPASEIVTISLALFLTTLNDVYNQCDGALRGRRDEIRTHVDNAINRVFETIGKERIKALQKGGAGGKLGTVLNDAANLSAIGGTILALLAV